MADTGRVPNAHQQIKIKVVDKDGWEKEFPFQKSIIHIGSNPRSDLFLEPGRGTGVAPLHAQLIVSTAGAESQLVNLGNADILLGPSGGQALPPRSVTGLFNETVIKLGDFTLIFYSDRDEDVHTLDGVTSPSRNIGLHVSLPQTQLAVNGSLSGAVTVSNFGEQTGVQFDLELEGLDSDCYDIEPAPLLSSGAEKDVVFHVHHRGNKPLAGDCRITISAATPQAYPGERATVSHTIQVLPLYHHELRLVPEQVTPALQAADVLEEDALEPEPQVLVSNAVLPSQTAEWWSVTTKETVPAPPEDVEQSLQVEEPTPSLEEIDEKVDEEIEQSPEAELGPSSQPEEQQPAQPEDIVSPDAQVAPQPVVEEEEKEPQAKVSLPAQTEEVEPVSETDAEPAPVAEIVPPPVTEDWWLAEAEAVAEEEREEPEADSPSKAQTEPAPTDETGPLSSAEDWWAPEAQVDPEEQAKAQVLKLKASPFPETEAELATPAQAGPSSSAEDWWSAEAAGDLQVEDRAVLKLTASPAPQADVEPAQVTDGPSSVTEDWWSVEGQEDSE